MVLERRDIFDNSIRSANLSVMDYDSQENYVNEYQPEFNSGGYTAIYLFLKMYKRNRIIKYFLSRNYKDQNCSSLSVQDFLKMSKIFIPDEEFKNWDQNNYNDSGYAKDYLSDDCINVAYHDIPKMKNEDHVFGKTKRGWIYVNQKVN